METKLKHEQEVFLEKFSKKFDDEVTPLYKGYPIHTNLVMTAFRAYSDGTWDEFMKRVKDETKYV